MMLFRCGDVVPGCDRDFYGDEHDVLAQVAMHVRHEHGLREMPEGLAGVVQDAMTPVTSSH